MRTETLTRDLYTFDELSDSAKDRARDWWRAFLAEEGNEWANSVLEDAATIGDILGINLRQRPVKLMGGGTRMEPAIYWSIDRDGGVAFDASYSYASGSVAKIRQHAPQDTELHDIARRLYDAQRRHFYGLTANIRATGHDGLRLDVEASDRNGYQTSGAVERELDEPLRDFAAWIHSALQREYDWRMADEQVGEDIRVNEYEFTEEGERAW